MNPDEWENSTPANGAPPPDLTRTRRQRKPDDRILIDRLPPNAEEMERGVLGCALMSPNNCLPQIITQTSGDVEAFYDLRHQTIAGNLFAMYDAREAIDIMTLQQRLKDWQLLEQIGGIPYLSALQDLVPSAANLQYYLDIVLQKYLLRRALQTCSSCVARIYEFEGEPDALIDELERDILQVRGRAMKSNSYGAPELVTEALQIVENYFNRQGEITGLSTGFPDLDRYTDGMQNGEMWVLAARPSMGKSSLMMDFAESVCINQKLPVGVFSLEMKASALMLRAICSRARINLRNVRDGFMSEADFPKMTAAAGVWNNSLIRIDDTPGLSIMELRARARMMVQQYGVKLILIDYLQLMSGGKMRSNDNREREIATISAGVKALAKELNIPVVLLSQLNRELEKDKNRKPRLSDLRESGAIEQDADLVGLLYKADGNDDEEAVDQEAQAGVSPVNLLIAKQRNGPAGIDVYLTFLKMFTRFESAARVADTDRDDPGYADRKFDTEKQQYTPPQQTEMLPEGAQPPPDP